MPEMIDHLALADAMGGADPVAAKAAQASLEKLAHTAGATPPGSTLRREAIRALLEIALSKRSRKARAHTLRLLGLIGGKSEERALVALEKDGEIGEDARMARERLRRGSK